jgi:hypothetical protein
MGEGSRSLSPPTESEGPSSRAVSGPTDALRVSRTWVRGLFQAGGLPSAEVGCGIDISTSFFILVGFPPSGWDVAYCACVR